MIPGIAGVDKRDGIAVDHQRPRDVLRSGVVNTGPDFGYLNVHGFSMPGSQA